TVKSIAPVVHVALIGADETSRITIGASRLELRFPGFLAKLHAHRKLEVASISALRFDFRPATELDAPINATLANDIMDGKPRDSVAVFRVIAVWPRMLHLGIAGIDRLRECATGLRLIAGAFDHPPVLEFVIRR